MHVAALILHIGAGSLAILFGGASLAVRKGGRLHLLFGHLFFLAMLVMTSVAAWLAIMNGQRGNVIAAGFVSYLVVTARMAIRRSDGRAGSFEGGLLLAALGLAAFAFWSGVQAAAAPAGQLDGFPAAIYFVLGSLVALAALLDINMMIRGGLSGRQRLARRVWRMCTALFFATGSFFIGQQKVMPASMHGSPILFALGLAPLPVMLFWLIRVRRGDRRRGRAMRLGAETA